MAMPVFQSKVGPIQVSVWENEVEVKGEKVTVQSMSIVKPYKDKSDKWVNGNSFKIADIFHIIMALQKVAEWKYVKEQPDFKFGD